MRIGVVGPSNMLNPEVPARIHAAVYERYGDDAPEILFHPQCFLSAGHFAGPDQAREDALVDYANDPSIDAIWCARGGYGANRIAERAIARMNRHAQNKPFVGYSDAGFLLAGLAAKRIGRPVHGPMATDINRTGGDAAVLRTIDWLIGDRAPRLEYYFGTLPARSEEGRTMAFNLTVLSSLMGTPLQPDFTGRVVMVEEVDEAMYRIDRSLFHVTSHPAFRRCAGLMLGRCAPITPNNPEFGTDEVAVIEHWCAVSGIPYLGRADIGHDVDNKVVPFG